MDINIAIKSFTLMDIFSIALGSQLVKGGKKVNPATWGSCELFKDRFCCYYWKDNTSIRYIGSITADYKSKQYKTNLSGRVSNYLQNHSGTTNKMVFNNVNKLLMSSPVSFGVFCFDQVFIDGDSYTYQQCIKSSAIMQMIEEILICRFRVLNQADWNRT